MARSVFPTARHYSGGCEMKGVQSGQPGFIWEFSKPRGPDIDPK